MAPKGFLPHTSVGVTTMSGQNKQAGAQSQPKDVYPLASRPITVEGRSQTVRLEPSYWEALEEICRREDVSVEELCSDLARRLDRSPGRTSSVSVSLANAIRVFIVGYYRQAATEYGHRHAGHGLGDPFRTGPTDPVTPALPN